MQVGTADRCGSDPDDGIGRLLELRFGDSVEADVAHVMPHDCFHRLPPCPGSRCWPQAPAGCLKSLRFRAKGRPLAVNMDQSRQQMRQRRVADPPWKRVHDKPGPPRAAACKGPATAPTSRLPSSFQFTVAVPVRSGGQTLGLWRVADMLLGALAEHDGACWCPGPGITNTPAPGTGRSDAVLS